MQQGNVSFDRHGPMLLHVDRLGLLVKIVETRLSFRVTGADEGLKLEGVAGVQVFKRFLAVVLKLSAQMPAVGS